MWCRAHLIQSPESAQGDEPESPKIPEKLELRGTPMHDLVDDLQGKGPTLVVPGPPRTIVVWPSYNDVQVPKVVEEVQVLIGGEADPRGV